MKETQSHINFRYESKFVDPPAGFVTAEGREFSTSVAMNKRFEYFSLRSPSELESKASP